MTILARHLHAAPTKNRDDIDWKPDVLVYVQITKTFEELLRARQVLKRNLQQLNELIK